MRIRAGLLTEFLTFKESVKVVSDSGFEKDEQKEVLTTRAYKMKGTGKQTEAAKEIFNSVTLTFLLRYNSLIKDTQTVEYNGIIYNISFLDTNRQERSIEITLIKKDK